jgi:hypothetical protein
MSEKRRRLELPSLYTLCIGCVANHSTALLSLTELPEAVLVDLYRACFSSGPVAKAWLATFALFVTSNLATYDLTKWRRPHDVGEACMILATEGSCGKLTLPACTSAEDIMVLCSGSLKLTEFAVHSYNLDASCLRALCQRWGSSLQR